MFSTKFWDFTTFKRFFPGIWFLLSEFVWIKNLSIRGIVYCITNVSTLQSSVFIRGDLKSQRGFLYTQEVTFFANKVEILLWQITSAISIQSMMIHFMFICHASSLKDAVSSFLAFLVFVCAIDNFPYRQIFYLDKFRQQKPNSRKEPFKSSKIPKFG